MQNDSLGEKVNRFRFHDKFRMRDDGVAFAEALKKANKPKKKKAAAFADS